MSSLDTYGVKAYIYYQVGEATPPTMAEDKFDLGGVFSSIVVEISTPGWHTVTGRSP